MGAKLCNLRNSGAAAAPPSDYDEYHSDERVDDHSRSFLRKLKPGCLNLKIEKHKKMTSQQHQESMMKEDGTTLEQWLLRSPSIDMMETSLSYSWRLSPKVCPLTVSRPDESGSGCSSTQGATVTGDEHRRDRVVSFSRRRSSSSNAKRVSFKSPEEADIHLIRSHYDSEEYEVY